MTPLDALETFLNALWTEHGDSATNGIELTLPHTLAAQIFREFKTHGNPTRSVTWISPYGKIVIRDADHA